MRLLRACLLDEPLPRLMAMADLWDAPLEATSQKDVAEALAAHMLVEPTLLRERDSLPDGARAALDAVVNAGGKMPLASFERRAGAIRPMGPGKLERERPWLTPANAAEALWYRGFISRAFDKAPGTPTEMIFVPSDLLAVLSAASATPSEDALHVQSPAQHSASNTQDAPLLDDVVTILCHIQNGDVKLKANGEWDAASRRALAPMLRDADGVMDAHPNGRFSFLLHLIVRLGWTRVADARLRLIPQPVTQWLQQPAEAQRDALYQAWLNDESWNDLAHVPGLSLQMTHTWANDPLRERRAIVESWGDWRLGIGDSDSNLSRRDVPQSLISTFVAHMKATNPDFARPDGRYDTWHVRDEASGEFLPGFEHWDKVEGALIQHVLERPVTWLSLDRVTRRHGDKVKDAITVSPLHPVTLSPDGRVTLAAWLRFERFQLARVADWAETCDIQYVYRLTPRSLARAREQGIRAPRVLEFLERISGQALPGSLHTALTRWAERGVEARLEPMLILKTQDAATMDALLRVQEIRRAVVDRFAPNCISIRQRDGDAVRAAIVASGLLVDWG
jgi:hypothetical protein